MKYKRQSQINVLYWQNREGNFMENKIRKKIWIVLIAFLLLAQPSAASLPFMRGAAITAEAASRKVSLSKKKLSMAIAGKTTVQLRNINRQKKIPGAAATRKSFL